MPPDIFSLFEADTKKQVEKVCSELTIKSEDIVYLVSLSEANIIEFPYLHASKFLEEVPANVHLTKKNIEAIKNNGRGELKRDARKAVKKMFQAPIQVKRTMAHMFYRCDHKFWHFLYFDLKDIAKSGNHWDYGSHIHYVSWLWPNLECQDVWSAYCQNGKKDIGGSKHIKFKR